MIVGLDWVDTLALPHGSGQTNPRITIPIPRLISRCPPHLNRVLHSVRDPFGLYSLCGRIMYKHCLSLRSCHLYTGRRSAAYPLPYRLPCAHFMNVRPMKSLNVLNDHRLNQWMTNSAWCRFAKWVQTRKIASLTVYIQSVAMRTNIAAQRDQSAISMI